MTPIERAPGRVPGLPGLLGLLLLLAAPGLAAPSAGTPTADTPSAETPRETERAVDPSGDDETTASGEEAQRPDGGEQASGPSSPEVFVPSEEISEDLSVSFPVDI